MRYFINDYILQYLLRVCIPLTVEKQVPENYNLIVLLINHYQPSYLSVFHDFWQLIHLYCSGTGSLNSLNRRNLLDNGVIHTPL